jgi:hypothetical protein
MKDKKQFGLAKIYIVQVYLQWLDVSRYPSDRFLEAQSIWASLQFQTSLILPENKKKKIQSLPKLSQYHPVS